MTVDFSLETIEARKKWHIFFKYQQALTVDCKLYPAKIFFRNEKEIMIYSDERKLRT